MFIWTRKEKNAHSVCLLSSVFCYCLQFSVAYCLRVSFVFILKYKYICMYICFIYILNIISPWKQFVNKTDPILSLRSLFWVANNVFLSRILKSLKHIKPTYKEQFILESYFFPLWWTVFWPLLKCKYFGRNFHILFPAIQFWCEYFMRNDQEREAAEKTREKPFYKSLHLSINTFFQFLPQSFIL